MKGVFGMAEKIIVSVNDKDKTVKPKGIFVTGTGTDIGKTYVTALIAKALLSLGVNVGYYKAAISGAESIEESDAGYVKSFSGLSQETETLLSYLYKNPLSPHLAAKIEGNPPCMEVIRSDYSKVASCHDYVLAEGSGGIVCPIRCDEKSFIMLEDIIKALTLDTIVVADSGLGTINSTVLTVSYLRSKNIGVRGIILNRFEENSTMHCDNLDMIEKLTNIPVVGTVKAGCENLRFLTDPKTIFNI